MIIPVQGGEVELRDWTSDDYHTRPQGKRSKKSRKPPVSRNPDEMKKTRPCFFHQHHPDGCPMSATDCRFVHEREDSGPAESSVTV